MASQKVFIAISRICIIGLILVCPHLITPIINQLNKQKRQRVSDWNNNNKNTNQVAN
jgi:hypothetical protein